MQQAQFSLYAMVLAVGAVQGVVLMMSLLSIGHGRQKANVILAILMLLFAYDLFDELLLESGYIRDLPRIVPLEHLTDLLYGPVIYLYVRQIAIPSAGANAFLKHFIPAGLGFAVMLYLVVALSDGDFIEFIEQTEATPLSLALYDFFTAIAGVFSMLAYLVVSLRLLVRHQRLIGDSFSYREAIDLRWLKSVLQAMGSLYLVYILLFILAIAEVQTPTFLDSILYISIVVCVFYLGFRGIRQPRVFGTEQSVSELDDGAQAVADDGIAYQGSGIDQAESRMILNALQQLLEREPLFLEPKLTLAELAEASGFKSHYISQAINQNLQVNFFDFINKYRIDYACQKLQADAPNVLAVAMESGFNSKSSFYSAFKKYTGLTPKQFQQRQKQ